MNILLAFVHNFDPAFPVSRVCVRAQGFMGNGTGRSAAVYPRVQMKVNRCSLGIGFVLIEMLFWEDGASSESRSINTHVQKVIGPNAAY